MIGGCSKCSGEGRVMVLDEGTHWHWEACPDCNGFEEMALTGGATCDNFGDVSPWALAVDAEINDDLPW
jgi:hypothetical protein